jgi:excinuclease ABC subunit C
MGRATAPRTVLAALPAGPGVYRFRDAAGRALYLGRATDLRQRVGSYWGDLRDRPHLHRMVPQVHRVEALPCRSAHEAAWLERTLLEATKPRWNRVRGGLEVPTWILLEDGRCASRLRVGHRPGGGPGVAAFGPYLGGTRSRDAVSGLERVLQLCYAGDRLGGSERDMARMRGVGPADRAARVGLARAVLARDPVATAEVLGALVALRDAAACALAFELAARIQAELDALAWVGAEQGVLDPGAPDAVLWGWAGGPMVRLDLCDGAVRRWSTVPWSPTQGPGRLAATPPHWAGFLADAAALAAALADAQADTGAA